MVMLRAMVAPALICLGALTLQGCGGPSPPPALADCGSWSNWVEMVQHWRTPEVGQTWLQHNSSELMDAVADVELNHPEVIKCLGYGEPTCQLSSSLNLVHYSHDVDDVEYLHDVPSCNATVNMQKLVASGVCTQADQHRAETRGVHGDVRTYAVCGKCNDASRLTYLNQVATCFKPLRKEQRILGEQLARCYAKLYPCAPGPMDQAGHESSHSDIAVAALGFMCAAVVGSLVAIMSMRRKRSLQVSQEPLLQ